MKELLESLWMEGWHSCDGAGSDTPDIDIEDYKEQINDAVGEYLKSIDEDLYECFLITKEIKKDTVGFKWFMRWYRIKDATPTTPEIFGLNSTLYDDLKSIREEKDQMIERGVLK